VSDEPKQWVVVYNDAVDDSTEPYMVIGPFGSQEEALRHAGEHWGTQVFSLDPPVGGNDG
jgi:hypothetical protein